MATLQDIESRKESIKHALYIFYMCDVSEDQVTQINTILQTAEDEIWRKLEEFNMLD